MLYISRTSSFRSHWEQGILVDLCLLVWMLFREWYHQSIAPSCGLPHFTHTNVLSLSFRSKGAKMTQTVMWPWMLECVNFFQMLFWPSQTMAQLAFLCISLTLCLLAFVSSILALFILCRSQCESWPSQIFLLHWCNWLCLFYTSFVQLCHFAYFSAVQAFSPWKYCALLYLNLVQMCQKVQPCHF